MAHCVQSISRPRTMAQNKTDAQNIKKKRGMKQNTQRSHCRRSTPVLCSSLDTVHANCYIDQKYKTHDLCEAILILHKAIDEQPIHLQIILY